MLWVTECVFHYDTANKQTMVNADADKINHVTITNFSKKFLEMITYF